MTTSKHDGDQCAAHELNVAGYTLKEKAGTDFLDFVQLISGFVRILEIPQERAHG